MAGVNDNSTYIIAAGTRRTSTIPTVGGGAAYQYAGVIA